MSKKDAQMSGSAVRKKAPSEWKKSFLKKKSFQFFSIDKIFKNVWYIFLKYMGLEIYNFWWFHGSEKLFFKGKLLIKPKQQKFKEISLTILDKIISQVISQNFYKIGLSPKELELLE